MKEQFQQLHRRQKILVVSALFAAVLVLISAVCGMYVNAWFKNVLNVENPARLSNFVTKTEYTFDGGVTWTELSSGNAVLIDLPGSDEAHALDKLQIRVSYQGHSAAYVRASVYGNFFNADTGTYLPQPETFWKMTSTGTNWVSKDGYMYYTSRVEKMDVMTPLTSTLKVTADISTLGDISSRQEYDGKLYVIVEAVQPDRYTAHWGVDSMPITSVT